MFEQAKSGVYQRKGGTAKIKVGSESLIMGVFYQRTYGAGWSKAVSTMTREELNTNWEWIRP